jgi:hypothetical protein
MLKPTRTEPHKPARSPRAPRPARRPHKARPHEPRPAALAGPAILTSRLEGDVDLIAPRGYHASVLLKLTHREDGHRVFSWWMLAGRHDMDAITVPFKYSGEEIIRVDLPEGVPLSRELIEAQLDKFLDLEGTEPPDPPTVKG